MKVIEPDYPQEKESLSDKGNDLTAVFNAPGNENNTLDRGLLQNGDYLDFMSHSSPNSSFPKDADIKVGKLSKTFSGRSTAHHSSPVGQHVSMYANNQTTSVARRRHAVLSVLDDAAHSAGIPRELLGAVWGIESTYGIKRHSQTGCTGDFQFTRNTFADIIRKYGSSIAAQLRGRGESDLADTISNYSQGLKHHSVRKDNADLQSLRDNPFVSPYAAAHLLADGAKSIHVNPANKEEWQYIYASYNLGPHAVMELRGKLDHTANAKRHLGASAAANATFFRNAATGRQVMQNYEDKIGRFTGDFARMTATEVPAPIVASTTGTPPGTGPALI